MAKQLPKRDLENVGLGVTGACVVLVTLVVAALIFMVAQKGLSAFLKDGVSVVEFFTGTKWDLANTAKNGLPYTGALPLIVTSFAVMMLSTLIALPIAIGSAIFAVEISPKFGSKIFQPLIELLTGIPSVVFGLIGFHVVVGLMKSVFHVSTGLGILPGAVVLAVMILPTMTTLSVDGLRAVPDSYRQGSLALGYTRWQTIWHVVLKSAMPSLMTAVILGMTRAFGETLAVRMVIGGIEAMPTSLLSPASTITTTLTTSMAVYAEGSAQDDVLWALGLLLMGMSLIFILIIHLIGRRGGRRLVASTRIHIDEARLGRVQKQDRIATGVLTAIAAIVMLIVISMVAYILFEGVSTLFQPGFLTQPSRANGTQGGVLYQLFDSFYLLLITLIISVPISLGGAVFLVEYAPNGPIRDIASTAIETLSSLPSIVVGMFGFLVFSVQLGWKYSIISGAVALTMFNIPILVRVIQQALEDVPQAQRDACLAMGLTRWEATLHILIPEAMPAIVTGIVLSAGRVFGEAAALLFTSGMSSPVRLNFLSFNLSSPTCAWNVFRPGESLAVHIYKIYGEGSPEAQQIVWGTAALLMICVLLFNVVARIVGKQLARKMTAE
mgnify:CR=1 FL=1